MRVRSQILGCVSGQALSGLAKTNAAFTKQWRELLPWSLGRAREWTGGEELEAELEAAGRRGAVELDLMSARVWCPCGVYLIMCVFTGRYFGAAGGGVVGRWLVDNRSVTSCAHP